MNKIEEIKEYISLLENSSLSVLEIEKEDGTKIHLEKNIRHSRFLMRHQSVHISRLQQMFLLLHLFSHRPLRLSLPLPRKTPRL